MKIYYNEVWVDSMIRVWMKKNVRSHLSSSTNGSTCTFLQFKCKFTVQIKCISSSDHLDDKTKPDYVEKQTFIFVYEEECRYHTKLNYQHTLLQ